MKRHVVLYGDVNLNIIDGSATWLISLAETLTLTDSVVHVVLKAQVTTDRLLTRLVDHPGIVIHEAVPSGGMAAMSHADAVKRLEDVVTGVEASVLIVRGLQMAAAAGASEVLSPRLWSYVTDFKFPATLMPPGQLPKLREVAARSRRFFVQTEETRAYIESVVPEAAGKCLLMTPTVPDDYFAPIDETPVGDRLELVYSGKLHPDWRTLEMTQLPALLAEAGQLAHLTILGDKVQSADPEWITAMRAALEDPPPDVTWAGGLPREEALRTVAAHDVGVSWRSPALDSSLEISTKMLEYAAAGTPPLVNRTPAHEELFGADYPLFTDGDLASVVATLVAARTRLPELRAAAQEAVRPYSSSATARRLEGYFRRTEPDYEAHRLGAKVLRVVLAGHDLKFAGELVELLHVRPDVDLRIDQWSSLRDHDEALSEELLGWADVVICEWAGPCAVWYSERKRPGQRLLVRLHRFELTAPWLGDLRIENVDSLITVSKYYHRLVLETTGWPSSKVHHIDNALDATDLARPKRPGARYALGLVGIVPFLKRPDRALDLLESLLVRDDRFRLHIKGRLPWEYPWIWRKPEEREAYLHFFDRIGSIPGLSEHVVFEPFGPDMANWLRGIGWLLSPSTHESFHLAPAEGMASGALPVFWNRDGVEEIFGPQFRHDSVAEMADFVLAHVSDEALWDEARERASRTAADFDLGVVNVQWLDHIFADRTAPEPAGP
ncbi:hypothetical protein LKO27_14135 [Tessaracoccus sp. OS52]|uniref:glycosyltransferase family protein n=1 Tax=Tessaracoccus sp. OS52 TaxID=2886691 RepID=UPI001D1081DE|nr:glycosyltransferase [Tessaracoccus sp. OS52]MCC2594541.1 hypothetical protein [Tessaracoccus sp. OS52]